MMAVEAKATSSLLEMHHICSRHSFLCPTKLEYNFYSCRAVLFSSSELLGRALRVSVLPTLQWPARTFEVTLGVV